MTRRQTYGERMADFEREKDERDWRRSFQSAIVAENYVLVEELIIDGISEEYEFPKIDNSTVLELVNKHQH